MEYGTIVASGVMGMVGTAVGALLNHFLARSSRLEDRVHEAKIAECRELIDALHRAFMIFLELGKWMVALGPEEQRELARAETDSVRILADRLYIAQDISNLDAIGRWTRAIGVFKSTGGLKPLSDALWDISNEVRNLALQKN